MILMNGYGLELSCIIDYLKEEYIDYSIYDFDYLFNNSLICRFSNSNNNYLYIPDNKPYEKSNFNSIEDIDKYFFKVIKPILKDNITFEQIARNLDDVCDYDVD